MIKIPNMKLKYLKNPFRSLKKARQYFLTKPNRIKSLAKLYKKFTTIKKPEKWVFIVGCYNSGTTLLRKILSTHSKISTIDEGVFKTDQLISPEELGWTRMWCKVIDEVRLKESDKFINVEELKKDWALFLDYNKSVFLEKSIVNSARIRWLQEIFSNSYFIFIVRNGYAVAEGIHRKAPRKPWGIQQSQFFNKSYPMELCAEQWYINNKIIEEDSEKIKRIKRIYYEDLCSNPKKIISEIYDFLNLNFEYNFNPKNKWKIHKKNSVIKNMNYKSFERLTIEDINKIEKVAGDMLEFYNYGLLSEEY